MNAAFSNIIFSLLLTEGALLLQKHGHVDGDILYAAFSFVVLGIDQVSVDYTVGELGAKLVKRFMCLVT